MDPQRTDSSSQDYTLISEGGKTEKKSLYNTNTCG